VANLLYSLFFVANLAASYVQFSYLVWIPAFAGMTNRRFTARIRSKMYNAIRCRE